MDKIPVFTCMVFFVTCLAFGEDFSEHADVMAQQHDEKIPLELAENQSWNVHGQLTLVNQSHPRFNGGSRPDGTNSLPRQSTSAETADFTLFFGLKLGQDTAIYFNPEIDQGFGIGNTLGLAGYASGEAYKVGAHTPYYRNPRVFIRHVVNLGGEETPMEDQANQLAQTITVNHVTFTFGKFSVVDIFDTNSYAHDARLDFLNWAGVEAGAFDYAADAWGYTDGLAVEWTLDRWTWRNGFFDLSTYPNSEHIDQGFKQFEIVSELESRYDWFGQEGKVKFLAFANRGKMGRYSNAIAAANGGIPNVSKVRHLDWKTGLAINFEQEITSNTALFGRISKNDGTKETFEFSDINRSASLGLSLKGKIWGRPEDTAGVQFMVNGLSSQAQQYLARGGLGLLIGDGYLDYGLENIAEVYYNFKVIEHLAVSVDLQNVKNPAYNSARGPINICAVRVHAEF
jgi:high affinity Mn2+ porin